MPINREDGRHWCAPDKESPDDQGQWVCPQCHQVWLYTPDLSLWETQEARETRLAFEAAADLAAQEIEQEGGN